MPKDVFWFKHDTNASEDPKIKAMRRKYGWEGVGWYWHVVELLRGEDGYQLESSDLVYDSLADDFRCTREKVISYITDCTESYDLFQKNTTHFYSSRLCRDMMAFESSREQRVLAGRRSAEKRIGTKTQLLLDERSTAVQQEEKRREDIEDIIYNGKKLKKFPPSFLPLVKTVFKGLKEQRGYNTTSPASEALAINQMLSENFAPEQILKAHELIKLQPFYNDKPVSMMLTRKNIHEVLNNGHNQNGNTAGQVENSADKYTSGKYGHLVQR